MLDFLGSLGRAAKRLIVPSLEIETPKPAGVHISGRFRMWQTRKKSGTLFHDFGWTPNGAATVGLNYLGDAGFRGSSQDSTWFCGLIANSGFSAVSAGDTMSSHAGWTELTDYDETTREAWSPAAASAGVLVNTTAMEFTPNATVDCAGIFIASDSTKSGTSGTLWATAVRAFSLTNTVIHSVIYELTLTPVS